MSNYRPSTSGYSLRSYARNNIKPYKKKSVKKNTTITTNIMPIEPYEGNFGVYLSEQYDVLRAVLSYLNYHDLIIIRKVNTSLQRAANIILKKRNWIQCSFINYRYNSDHWESPAYNGHYVDLKIEPKLLLTFELMSSGYSSRSRPLICSRLENKNGTFDFKSDIVPSSVDAFVPVGVSGLIVTDPETNELISMPGDIGRRLILVYLPQSQDYDVTVFTQIVTRPQTLDQEQIQRICDDPRPIRGIVCLKAGGTNINILLKLIVNMVSNSQIEPFALVGGNISNLDYENPPKKHIPCVFKAIFIRGNGVRCLSDIITATKQENVLEYLQTTATYVKENFGKYEPQKSIILMFECVERFGMSTEDYMGLTKTYPGIPIIGLQSWGEIGFKSFDPNNTKFTPKRKPMPLEHTITTSYMLIAIN